MYKYPHIATSFRALILLCDTGQGIFTISECVAVEYVSNALLRIGQLEPAVIFV
jgi:hypothetical protein